MITEIKTKKELDDLTKVSAPTWEGLSIDNLESQLKGIDPKVEAVYCTGATYNKAYKLTQDNAYPNDLTIVFLKNYSISQMSWKLQYGCRWADDVKDNNLRRQRAINRANR